MSSLKELAEGWRKGLNPEALSSCFTLSRLSLYLFRFELQGDGSTILDLIQTRKNCVKINHSFSHGQVEIVDL